MQDFCTHLRTIRKNHKATQKQVALAVGVTERNYQDWEYGNTKPGFDALLALADYFDVSLDYLVGRVSIPESFRAWLLNFDGVDSILGDFAHDVKRDDQYPADEETYERLYQYFDWQAGKHDNPVVMEMFKTAWAFHSALVVQD